MKKFAKVLMTVAGLLIPVFLHADAFIDNSALSQNSVPQVDTVAKNYGKLSATAVYSTATIAAVVATDGRPSTAAITVTNNAAFTALSASNTITISSNAACKFGWVKINERYFVNPQDFAVALDTHNVGFSTQTAQNLTNAINASASSATITAARSGSLIFLASKSSGSYFNSYTLTSSSPAAFGVTSANFYNGRDAAQLKIGNKTLTNGSQWFTGATAAQTAQSISSAIVAFAGSVAVSTWNGSVVYSTSIAIGANTTIILSSTQTALTISSVAYSNGIGSGYFQNGSASALSGGYVNKANAFGVGLPVLYSTTTGTNLNPLVSQTTYFVTAVDSTKFKIATSRANAIAGTAVTFTTLISTGAGTFTFTPIPYSAGAPASFKYERSNDGSNWFDAPVSSGTVYVTAVSSGQAADFGDANFKYYRINFVTSDFGATNLKSYYQGK
jgi:hypothetical protein